MNSYAATIGSVEFGPKGFLANFDDWNEELAEALAAEDGLQLRACHWTALRFLREYYYEYQVPPSPRTLVKRVGDKLDTVHCTTHTLKELFPRGGCKQACRIAGLPTYYCNAC